LPANEEINTVRVDFRQPGVVFAGVGHRLFKSTSGGASWTAIGEFPDIIYDVLTGSLAAPDMIVVSSNGPLFRTDDGGSHWTSIGDDLKDTIIENVVIDPASDTTLYAATFRGLFVTTDCGAHWRQSLSLGLLRSWVWMITVDGGNPATVRVLTDSGPFASADGGNTWRRTTNVDEPKTVVDDRWKASRPNGQVPEGVTVVPGDPLRAFAIIGEVLKRKSVWRTVDGGAMWLHADDCSPLVVTAATCRVIVDPNDSRVVYEITVGESSELGDGRRSGGASTAATRGTTQRPLRSGCSPFFPPSRRQRSSPTCLRFHPTAQGIHC